LPEWAAQDLREVSAAPRAIAVAVAIGMIAGWWGASHWYAERIEVLQARLDGQPAETTSKTETAPSNVGKTGSQDFLSRWGGGAESCEWTVHGDALREFASKYRVIAICGAVLEGVDRFSNVGITVSDRFRIEPHSITIRTQLSTPMKAQMGDVIRRTRALVPKPAANLGIEFGLWFDVAVIPEGVDAALIKTLSDVERFGGKVLHSSPPGQIVRIPVWEPK
jgi:hypothetical protein